ncbi:related to retrotransposon hobase [Lasallia pustulata]|uniref:Related to retrotransposon hobase n=1 Tax=Lasallia pustulata TaxID=136370 RepID=A0A1W5CRT0_9LECA|nr:related to retrotransposon hobase [Lasallia pustulata]
MIIHRGIIALHHDVMPSYNRSSNGTWKEVVLPKGANIVTSKWVFKPKLQTDGKLDKLKARIVTRGFSQMHGINYEDTFAPTIKYDTLRAFLAIVAMEDLECHQVDMNNAFIKSFLKEEIYMAAPPGVKVAPG